MLEWHCPKKGGPVGSHMKGCRVVEGVWGGRVGGEQEPQGALGWPQTLGELQDPLAGVSKGGVWKQVGYVSPPPPSPRLPRCK